MVYVLGCKMIYFIIYIIVGVVFIPLFLRKCRDAGNLKVIKVKDAAMLSFMPLIWPILLAGLFWFKVCDIVIYGSDDEEG